MHPSTEDLLSVRDGEPLDAARATACERPEHTFELDRLRRTRDALRALPQLAPPPGVWQRAVEAERVSRRSMWPRALAGLGVAAAVAAVAVFLIGEGGPPAGPEPAAITPAAVWRAPALVQTPTPTYTSLVQESARLEQVLSQISYQRPLMTGGTAGTIAGLEDRIAAIDELSTYGSARGLRPAEREALLSERVDLLNALVHVRFAQSQKPGF
ncbi:MAG TPA: hypothetical protein VFX89_12080 [Gammaproteobacteria bacterium]|nr:hypothetical protein [Gammaproteobacteria bacterium]